MGLYDRDYMKADKPRPTEGRGHGLSGLDDSDSLTFWQRLRFKLWLLLHRQK